MNKRKRKLLQILKGSSPTGRLSKGWPEMQDLTWGRRPGKATIMKHTALGTADFSALELRVLSHPDVAAALAACGNLQQVPRDLRTAEGFHRQGEAVGRLFQDEPGWVWLETDSSEPGWRYFGAAGQVPPIKEGGVSKQVVYLKKDRVERFNSVRYWRVDAWRLVDGNDVDLVQPWFENRPDYSGKAAAKAYAAERGWIVKET